MSHRLEPVYDGILWLSDYHESTVHAGKSRAVNYLSEESRVVCAPADCSLRTVYIYTFLFSQSPRIKCQYWHVSLLTRHAVVDAQCWVANVFTALISQSFKWSPFSGSLENRSRTASGHGGTTLLSDASES